MTRTSTLLALLTLVLLLPGCGLKRHHECRATISYAGKTVTGRGADFDDPAKATAHAKKNMCESYCYDQDPVVDAAVNSQPGGPPSSVERYTAIHKPAVEPIFKACLSTCTAATATAAPQVTCSVVGFLLSSLAGVNPR